MAKAKKLPPALKTRITKLFKGGMLLPDIMVEIEPKFAKINIPRIKTVLKAHFLGHCDTLWAEAVKLKAGNICIIDRKPCSLNAHHLIGRSNYKYRWDIENGLSLGIYRHTMANDLCAHGSTSATHAFAIRIMLDYPKRWKWFQEHCVDQEHITVTVYYLLETAQRLEKEIEDLKKKPKVDIMARRKVEQ
jgi:hypothetical protein